MAHVAAGGTSPKVVFGFHVARSRSLALLTGPLAPLFWGTFFLQASLVSCRVVELAAPAKAKKE